MSLTTKDIQELERTLAQNPDNRAAFDALEERLLQARRWQDLLRVYNRYAELQEKVPRYWDRALQNLEKLAAELEEVPDRAEVLVGIGEIWERHLSRRDQAMVYYQRAFKVWPYQTRSLDLARNIYAQQGNWKLVIRLYELQLQVMKDPGEQAAVFREIARIHANHLGDYNASEQLLKKAAALAPEPVRGGAATVLLPAVALEPDLREDEPVRPAKVAEPAKVVEPAKAVEPVKAAEPAKAVEPVKASEPEPVKASEPEPVKAAEPEPVKAAEPAKAVEPEPVKAVEPEPVKAAEPVAVTQPMPTEAAPAEQPKVVVGKPEEGAEGVRGPAPTVLMYAVPLATSEAPPSSPRVPARPLARQTGPQLAAVPQAGISWEESLKRNRAELARARGASASALYVRIARTLIEHEPESVEIEESLQKAVEADPHNAEARNLALDLLRSQGRWEELASALDAKAGDATTKREDARSALIELAEVRRDRLGDEGGAAGAFQRLLALDPSHPDALGFARAYYERTENWTELVALYENALKLKRRGPEETALLLELGQLLWRRVEDMEAAERQYRKIRLADAKQLDMLRFYREYHKWEKNWQKYYTTVSTLRQTTEDEAEQLELSIELARVAREEMNAPEKAIDVWKSVLKADPRNKQARQALHDLYIEAKKWNALVEHYKEEIALLDPRDAGATAAQVELSLKMVEVYRDHLKLDVMVINTYNAVLQLDPGNLTAMDALGQRYEQAKRWNDLIGILDRKANVVQERGERAEVLPILHQTAELWQKRLNNASQAIPVFERILELDAGDRAAIGELKKLYTQRREWSALLVVLEKEAALLEGAALGAHLAEMASLAGSKLSDEVSAQGYHERVCAALEGEGGAVSDAALYRAALRDLEKIYEARDDDHALARVLERRLRVTESAAQRVETLERLAALVHGPLKDVERATRLWGQILELDSANEGALSHLTEHFVQQRRWDDLEGLFGRRGDWGRLFELLDNCSSMVDDEAERVGLFRRMARVSEEQLKDADKVMLSLESILSLEPANTEVARALLPYYRQAGEAAKEVQANAILLEQGAGDAFALTCEIGRLYEEKLQDKAQAFDWIERAFRMRPEDEALRAQLEALGRSAGRLAELVASYRQVAEGVEAQEVRLALYRVVARTCHLDLDWLDDAVDYFERILRALPEDEEAVDALLVLYRRLERWEELLGVMGRKIELLTRAGQEGEVVALRFQMAELLQGELGRRLDAVGCYKEVLALRADNLDAVRGLKGLYQQGEDWDGVAEATQQELALLEARGDEAGAQELRLQLGNLFEYQLEQLDGAVGWYASLLGSAGGSRAPAASALEGLLASSADGERRVRIAGLLEPVHRKDENWARLIEVLEIRLGAMGSASEQAATLWELAGLYEQRAEDLAGAFGALRRLLALTSEDARVWDELERVAGRTGRWEEVAGLYGGLTPTLDELGADGWRFDLLRRLARVYEQELKQDAEARGAYEILLARDGADRLTLDSLDEVYGRLGAWSELVDLLRRKVALLDDSAQRREVRFRVAGLYEDQLSDPSSAIDAYREVLGELPADEAALSSLERLLGAESRWEELVELLSTRIGLAATQGAAHDLRYQLGSVRQHQLGDAVGAVEEYRAILAQDPAHADALGAMEALCASLHAEGGELGLQRTVHDTLEPLYERAEAWGKLVGVLALRLGYADADEARAGLRVRMARLERDKLSRLEVGFGHLKEAVALRFEDRALREELEALAAPTQLHNEVVELYESLLHGASDALQREVLERIAQLQERELSDVPAAIDAWRRALDLDAQDAQALDALERLYEGQARWADLVEVCLRKAELASGEAQVGVLRKVGALYRDQLAAPSDAIDTYRRILALVPGDAGALDALEALFEGEASWAELVENHRAKVASAADVEAKRGHWLRIARLQEEQLGDAFEAIDTYRTLLGALPEDGEALDALDRLFGAHERWEEQAEVLGRKLALAQADEAAWCGLRFRLGQVQQDKLAQVGEALETYRSILDRQPRHEPTRAALRALLGEPEQRNRASQILEPVLRAEGGYAEVVRLLELQLEEREEAQERLRLLDDIAGLHEGPLGDASAAFHAVRRAYLIDPTARPRVMAMERLAGQTGEHGALVLAYEEALPGLTDGAEALRVLLKVAQTYRDELSDAGAAEDAFRKALDQEPSSLAALEALEQMLTGQQRWRDLLEVLERKHEVLAGAGRGDEALGVLFKVAQLRDDVLGEPGEAIEVYLRVLAAQEANAEAIHALKALYRREGRWHDLTELLVKEIGYAGADVATAVRLRTELATVWRDELGEPAQAVEVYRQVLAEVPEHAETVASLEALFGRGEEAQLVAETLEPIYRRRQAWAPLVAVLEVRLLEQEGDDQRRATLTQVARIHEEKLGAMPEAMGAWRRLLDEDPASEGVWEQLERLAAATDAWALLAEGYGEVLAHNMKVEDGVRQPLLLRRARILDERLDDVEGARDVYREVLVYDEQHAESVDALERLLTRLEAWDELVVLYERQAQLTQDAGRALVLWTKIATLQEEVRRDPDSAAEAYLQILDLDAREPSAVRGLERIYKQEARWRDLAELYRREAEGAQPAEAIRLKHLLGGVLEAELGEVADAVEIYRDILAQDPSYRPTRAALEGLLRGLDDQDLRLQVAMILQPLYDEATEWERLVAVHEVKLEVAQDPLERVGALQEIARLRERYQGDTHAAFEAYARAFGEDPNSEELQAHLERLASALARWGRLIEIYLQVMADCADTQRAVALLHRSAQVYLEKLGDRDSAITVYRQVLDVEETNLDALLKLEELYAQAGLWRDLVDVLYRKAELREDVLERKETYYRIAGLWEKSLGDDPMAIDTYRQILDLDEEDLVAIEALERLYRRSASWENLITIYHVKTDLVEGAEEKVAVWKQVAQLQEQELGQVSEAILAWQTVRELDAQDAECVEALDRLFTREARWYDLLEILEVKRERAAGSVEALNGVEFRMGQLLEEHLDDVVRAIDLYRQIVERTPDHLPAIEALEHLITVAEFRLASAQVLEPLYERKGEWRKLVDALELRLQETQEADERRQILERMAGIHEHKLSSPALAFVTWGRAFREDPEQPQAQGSLERLTLAMGNWDELVAIYEEKLDEIYDFALLRKLNLRLGQLHEEKLGNAGAAIERLRRVLEIEEYDRDALEGLDRLYQREQQWQDLSEILERKIQSSEGRARAELKFRLGYLMEVIFSDLDQAISRYREILAEVPDHKDALEALERLSQDASWRGQIAEILEPLYEDKGQWEKLVASLGARLELTSDPGELSGLRCRIAGLQEEQLGDAPAAFESYAEALRQTPGDREIAERVERLAASCGLWAAAAGLYEQIAGEPGDPAEQCETLLKAAAWRRERLGQSAESEALLRRVLELDPEKMEALDALEGIYVAQRRARALYDLYDHKARVLYDAQVRKGLYARMAQLAQEDLGERPLAIEAYEKLRELDDLDAQVLVALEGLYGEEQAWERLLEVVERRIELADEAEQRVALWLKVGAVARDRLGDLNRAVEAHRHVLDLDAGHRGALDALEALLAQVEDWPSLQEVLARRLAFCETDAEQIALHLKLAALAEERFSDVDGALEHYRQVFLHDPQHRGALAQLERLYQRAERWYDLLEVYRQQLDLQPTQAESLRLHVAISDIAANQIGDLGTAKEHLQHVLDADPNNVDALGVLGSLYLNDGEWERALEINARQLSLSSDPAALSRLHLSRGKIFAEHFDNLDEAEICYREAVTHDVHSKEARAALKELLRARAKWDDLLALQSLEAEQLQDASARVQLYLEMAELARERLQDPARAVVCLELAYRASQGEIEVAERLLQAYIDAAQMDKAEPILEGIIKTLTEQKKVKQLFKFHHLRGQIAEGRGSEEAALASYQAAYDIDAAYIPNLLSLGKLQVKRKSWDEGLKVFQALLLHQMKIKADEDKRDVYFYLGLIREAQGDPRRAKDMFNRALTVDKNHGPSREALARVG